MKEIGGYVSALSTEGTEIVRLVCIGDPILRELLNHV
jgi:hypothetical protein